MLKGVVCDNRIGSSHSKVPGNENKFGFGGTCFPKDINALNTFANEKLGSYPPIINAVINRNENIDRKEKEWEK